MNLAFTARNLEGAQADLDRKLSSTTNAFLEEIEGKKTELTAEWKEYEHKTRVANLFLSYLGWVATPLFWLICLLTVLMGIKETSKEEDIEEIEEFTEPTEKKKVIEEVVDNKLVAKNVSFSKITSQVTTELDRLIKYIASKDSDTHTPANNLIKMYNLAKEKDLVRFNAMITRLKIKYSTLCQYETILKYC
jgi:hypothetical protein